MNEESKKSGKVYGSQSGTTRLYVVEARATDRPLQIAGNLVTKEWERVYFPLSGDFGVQSCSLHPIRNDYLQLYTFECATALMHWFLSTPEAQKPGIPLMHPLCLEARLVEVRLDYKYETEETGVGETVSHFEGRRNAKFTPRDKA